MSEVPHPMEKFQVELPIGTTAALEAISALVIKHGGNIQRVDPVSDVSERVENAELEDISQRLWGTPTYAGVTKAWQPSPTRQYIPHPGDSHSKPFNDRHTERPRLYHGGRTSKEHASTIFCTVIHRS